MRKILKTTILPTRVLGYTTKYTVLAGMFPLLLSVFDFSFPLSVAMALITFVYLIKKGYSDPHFENLQITKLETLGIKKRLFKGGKKVKYVP